MFEYVVYGIGIHSNLELPELTPVQSDRDVTIIVKEESGGYVEPARPREYLKVSPEETLVALKCVGLFQIRNGSEIIVIPAPNADRRLMQLCLAGSIMAVLLYQRGVQVLLHASAVEVQGEMVGFLGDSGAGKSSMAITMLSRGHGIISDDLVPVQCHPLPATVWAGYPQMKFSAEVAAFLGYSLDSLIYVHPLLDEYAYRSTVGFPKSPRRLNSLFILVDSESDVPSVELIKGPAAVMELIRYCYGMPSLQPLLDRTAQLHQCVTLAETISIYRLHRPRRLEKLPEVAALVEETARRVMLTSMTAA
jgi:HPr Serine kinase C-terminal domain